MGTEELKESKPKTKKETKVIPEDFEKIENIATKMKIKDSILKGIMLMNGWTLGKYITEKDLEKALIKFLNKPV